MNKKGDISRIVKILLKCFSQGLCVPYCILSAGNIIAFWQCCSVIICSATINFFKCVTKGCLKGFVVIQPIILRKLPHCNSICFLVILYSFSLVNVCRLLRIWIQLGLYVNLIICPYMCSTETHLLIRVWRWVFMFKLLCLFIRQSSITWIPDLILTLAFRHWENLGTSKYSKFVLRSGPDQVQTGLIWFLCDIISEVQGRIFVQKWSLPWWFNQFLLSTTTSPPKS